MAKRFIDDFYYKKIDLESMAEKANFSKFHFIRLFKGAYGNTPHQYLTSIRIHRARLLLQTPAKVSSICFWVGFDSISSFTGLFKKITGFTPSDFQNRHKKRESLETKTAVHYIPWGFTRKDFYTKNRNFEEVPA
jgi:AraC-like DNA-binding protein